jgi:hypothetical protein
MLHQAGDVGHRIVGMAARAERGPADVDGVGAVLDGLDADVGIACRGEKFESDGLACA